MGECLDFHVGEPVLVEVPFDPPHVLDFPCTVAWVWEDHIDVRIGDVIGRYPRAAFDNSRVELGDPSIVRLSDFDEHFPRDEYDPEEELDA
jgi:hypothetical protein